MDQANSTIFQAESNLCIFYPFEMVLLYILRLGWFGLEFHLSSLGQTNQIRLILHQFYQNTCIRTQHDNSIGDGLP